MRVFLFFICLSNYVFGQSPYFQPRIDFFSIPNQEINTDEITDIQTDQEGYIWIISLSSIYKFNGRVLQKIRSKHTEHRSFLRFFETEGNQKYVNDYLGNIFFIEKDSLRPYKKNNILRRLKRNRGFTDLRFDEASNLHVAYDNSGYNIIKKDTIINVLNSRGLDFRGLGAIVSNNKEPFIFKGGLKFSLEARAKIPSIFKLFNENLELVDSIQYTNRDIYSPIALTQLPNKNHLFSTGKGSLIEFNKEGIVREINYPCVITRLFVDQEKNLWVSTMDKGIVCYPKSIIEEYNKVLFLENSNAFISTQDYQGGLWVYSSDRGLGYFSRLNLKYLKDNVRGSEFVIDVKGENFFFAKNKTVYKYNEEENRSEFVFESENERPVIDLYYDSSNQQIWVSSRGEFSMFSNGKEKKIDASLLYDWSVGGQVEFLSNINKDTILAMTKQEYFYLSDARVVAASEIFPKKMIGALRENNEVWINNINGIYKETLEQREFLGEKHKLAKSHSKEMLSFNGEKVFSFSSKGIFHYTEKTFKEIKFKNTSLLNSSLIVENDTTLWAISTSGCFSITVDSKSAPETTYTVIAFRPLPRVAIKELQSNHKTLYFTTHKGNVGKIDFDQIRKYPLTKPRLVINRIETMDSLYHKAIQSVELKYEKRNIQFGFESIDFQNLNLSYRYMLEGYDKSWVSTYSNLINYVSLPAGNYSFKVQSKFGLGGWGKEEIVQIRVLKPYWQKAWFIISCLLLGFVIVYQVIAYRFRNIHKRQSLMVDQLRSEQKALRAQMAPHYIFNIIASLKYLVMEESRKKTNRFLDLFAGSMRNVLDQANTNYITVNSEIEFILEYLEMERFRLEKSFNYNLEKKNLDEGEFIPPFMIQPFVENAIQHGLKRKGKGGKINLKFEKKNAVLKVTITDNGVGRKKSKEFKRKKIKNSYGISLIERRLAIHNKSGKGVVITDLYYENKKPAGTEVVLFIRFFEPDELLKLRKKPLEDK